MSFYSRSTVTTSIPFIVWILFSILIGIEKILLYVRRVWPFTMLTPLKQLLRCFAGSDAELCIFEYKQKRNAIECSP